MKNKIFTLFFALVASIGTMFAGVVKIGDLYYNLNTSSQTAEVTSSSDKYSGDIIIPSSVTYNSVTYSVTSIDQSAFYGCSSLTSVTIPNSVTSIAYGAFHGCSGLTSIVVDNGNTTYDSRNNCNAIIETATNTLILGSKNTTIPNSVTSIGSSAFSGCSSLTSITIPNSVTSIGGSAFEDCSGLNSVTIPNSITNIGGHAFASCSGLTSVTIGNSVTNIGSYAFTHCSGLTTIDIPNSVTTINDFAFSSCSGLTSVAIPNSVTNIGNYAFYNCSGLISATIGNSVTSIGECVFSDCNNLTSIDVADENSNYCSIDGCLFNKNITEIIVYPGGKQGGYTIPNSVTTIGVAAFFGCNGLTSLTIPNNVTSIGSVAFRLCENLSHIYVGAITPPSVESNTFIQIATDATAHVPFGTKAKYKSVDYWKDLNIIGPAIQYSKDTFSTSISLVFGVENTELLSCGIEGGEQQLGNVLELISLEPDSAYSDISVVLTANTGETETVNVSFTTTALELTTKQSKPVSSNTAILLAETNMSDAEVSCGFEWKRNDAPADMEGNKVYCPVASGQMAGRLKGLKDDVYYKYRAFYQSAAGNMYYGDWQYIFTGDVAVEFDPILYTYGATVVRENEATISGYALAGSEDFTEQGFEYWAESRTNGGANAPHRVPAALNEHFFVQAGGISLRVTLTNLDAGTVYKYRVYGKVGDQYYYGAEQSFATSGTYTPPTYTIIFVNWDGAVLQSSQVTEDELPEYTGETPERPADEQYTYTFIGWSPDIVAVTADATYTATYEANSREGVNNIYLDSQVQKLFRDGQIVLLRGDHTYTLTGQEVK